jgi:hypothetical protein
VFQPLIERRDGARWRVASPPPLAGDVNIRSSVSRSGPDDVGAVGAFRIRDIPVTLHWDRTSWTRPTRPREAVNGRRRHPE